MNQLRSERYFYQNRCGDEWVQVHLLRLMLIDRSELNDWWMNTALPTNKSFLKQWSVSSKNLVVSISMLRRKNSLQEICMRPLISFSTITTKLIIMGSSEKTIKQSRKYIGVVKV